MKDELKVGDVVEIRHLGEVVLGEVINTVYFQYDSKMMAYPVIDVKIPGEPIRTVPRSTVSKYSHE